MRTTAWDVIRLAYWLLRHRQVRRHLRIGQTLLNVERYVYALENRELITALDVTYEKPPRTPWVRIAIVTLLCLLVTHALTGCSVLAPDPMTRPTVMPSSKARPKPRVYSHCDENGVCRKYDGRGERRYDCERAWSDCDG